MHGHKQKHAVSAVRLAVSEVTPQGQDGMNDAWLYPLPKAPC